MQFWPLDQIRTYLIHVGTVRHKDCHSKFHIRNRDARIVKGQSEDYVSLGNDHIGPCQCVIELVMLIVERCLCTTKNHNPFKHVIVAYHKTIQWNITNGRELQFP